MISHLQLGAENFSHQVAVQREVWHALKWEGAWCEEELTAVEREAADFRLQIMTFFALGLM